MGTTKRTNHCFWHCPLHHLHPLASLRLLPDREVWTTPAERQKSKQSFFGNLWGICWARAIPNLCLFHGHGQWPETNYEWRYFHPNIFAKDPKFWQNIFAKVLTKKETFVSSSLSQSCVMVEPKKKNANPINPEGFKNIHHSSPKQWSTATSFPIMPSFLLQSNRILKVGMVIPPIFPKVPQSSLGILRAPHFLSPIWHLLFAGHGECLLFGPGTMPLNMMAGKTTKC